ncbi:MAG: hypothetical protein ACO3EZ_16135 [Prochlorotrichaceae cyanobacterium]|jgi:hypothetical protein
MKNTKEKTIAILNKHFHFELASAVRIGFLSEQAALERSGLIPVNPDRFSGVAPLPEPFPSTGGVSAPGEIR